jgi:hypothetical protein
MAKNTDNLEKSLTIIFSIVATIAILINLSIKGFNTENILDAVKDIAGVIVIIAVFLVASKIFTKDKFDFNAAFEKHLKEWVNQNKSLVTDVIAEPKGNYSKRYCMMVFDHSKMIDVANSADAVSRKEKGAFVYLPYLDENKKLKEEFEFRLHEKHFLRSDKFKKEDGTVDIPEIVDKFAANIYTTYKSLNITVKPVKSQGVISVDFSKMDKTEENAKLLTDVVEYVKTMVLALA